SDSSSQSSSDFSSESETHGESHSESSGESQVPVWVPIPRQELTTEAEWTREEKLSKVAQLLKEQMQQHCFIKLDTEKTQPLLVPFVKDYGLPEKALTNGTSSGCVFSVSRDRKSTRLNSSHVKTSYAVFCLKK